MTMTAQKDDREALRQSRLILRRIEAHLRQAHLALGAQRESLGMVEVVHHPQSQIAGLNYIMPRRNTAWVSGNYLEDGLTRLVELQRRKRVRFMEGLYLPVFARTLLDLGLKLESENPIMVYQPEGKLRTQFKLPSDIHLTQVDNHESMSVWWYVWQNAHYDVMTSAIEPLAIGRMMQEMYIQQQQNIILYRQRFPIGAARVCIIDKTAHLVAIAIMKEFHTIELEQTYRRALMDVALNQGSDLIFVHSDDDKNSKAYRELGFVDSGSIVSYAEEDLSASEGQDDALAQSVLVL